MKTKQTVEQRAEAEKANYRWYTTSAIGRPLPVGTLRVVGPRNVPGSKHPNGYFVSFAGCSCEASGWCRHQYLMGTYHLTEWYAGMPDFTATVKSLNEFGTTMNEPKPGEFAPIGAAPIPARPTVGTPEYRRMMEVDFL